RPRAAPAAGCPAARPWFPPPGARPGAPARRRAPGRAGAPRDRRAARRRRGSRRPGANARIPGTARPAPRRSGARRRNRARVPHGGRWRRRWTLTWTAAIQALPPGSGGGLLLSALRAQPAPVPMSVRLLPFRRAILLLLVIALTTSGCARIKGAFKNENENEGVPVEELYEKGLGQMHKGNWGGAAVTYRRLLAQYPYGPYTEQALMESAYAYFKMGNNEEAISTIDRFLRTYPTHRNTPYMCYLRGLVNSNRDTVFMQR